MPVTRKPPNEPTKRKRRFKFRTDLIPWLSKRKPPEPEADPDDPLLWDKTEAEEHERNRWPAVVAISAILGTGAGIAYSFTRPAEEVEEIAEPAPPLIFTAAYQQMAQDCLKGFHEAETVQEKLEFVAWADRVESRMHDYYGRNPDEPTQLDDIRFISSSPNFETDTSFFLATAMNGEELMFYVLAHEGDALKIDWECLVAYGPMGLDEFIGNPPADAVPFRLMATDSDYYNYEFSDRSRYKAYDLTSIDSERRLHAYVEIGSEVHTQIGAALSGRNTPVPLRVLLAPPGAAGRPACKIERLIKPHWSGE